MILHFDQALVHRLLAHSAAASQHRATFGQAEPAPAGLWLVGDTGVYLMSNGVPGLYRDPNASSPNVVCYAREADPDTLDVDAADDAKRASFGRDDGVEFIAATDLLTALASYPPQIPVALDVTQETIGILLFKPAARPGKTGAVR
ncbi:MAG: DUF3085 domain-containing protein [Acetobacteraceae bacterium]